MTERNLEQELCLHEVKNVIEVKSYQAANELLRFGWVLHDVFLGDDWRSTFLLLSLNDVTCPRCGNAATIEVTDEGESIRYVCSLECV